MANERPGAILAIKKGYGDQPLSNPVVKALEHYRVSTPVTMSGSLWYTTAPYPGFADLTANSDAQRALDELQAAENLGEYIAKFDFVSVQSADSNIRNRSPLAENATASHFRPVFRVGGSAGAQNVAQKVNVLVVNAWNDTVGGVLFIHDSVKLTGSSEQMTVGASNFTLTETTKNGSTKQYNGLQQAAPTYQKVSPVGQGMVATPEVDPAEDLGNIRSVILPAHGTLTTTVTFEVPDAVADPKDNRKVTLH